MFPMKNRWSVLALFFFARTSMGVVFLSIPPLLPEFVQMWGISYARAGLLISVAMFAGIGLALPTGMLARRFGDRSIVLCGLFFMALGSLLVAHAPGYGVALAGRVLVGVGVVFLNVQCTKVITDWFVGKEIATGLGILVTSWPLGMGVALLGMAPLSALITWRASMALVGALSALFGLLILLFYRDPPAQDGAGGGRLWSITRRELLLILPAALVWTLPNVGFIIFNGFAPAFLQGHGIRAEQAGLIVGVASWITIPLVPLGGWLHDRFNHGAVLIIGGVLVSAGGIAAVGLGYFWVGIVAFGVGIGFWPGAIMALPGSVLQPASRATGFGIFYTVFYVLQTSGAPLAGWLRDLSENPAMPIFTAVGFLLASIPALGAFYLLRRRLG